jgi:hypothetical protein
MSVEVFENLIKIITVNTDRIEEGKSSLCKTDEQVTVGEYLPCAQLDENGKNIIQCEDCCFNSVEAGRETIEELKHILAVHQLKTLLLNEQ